MTNLISRLVVGIVGLPVVLGLVWLGGWWLYVLVLLASLVAVHEFVTVSRPLRPLAPAIYLGVALSLTTAQTSGVVWMVGGLLSTFVFAFATMLGAAWIGLGLGYLIVLRHVAAHGRLLAFTILLTVWAADTFAYFGGRLLGRHKLAPTLSPGKTWEGFVIGSLAGIFVSFVALYDTRHSYLNVWQAVVLGVVVVLAAVAGDLFESMLKRDMQVKDTGRLLGGHGGILDRVDALLFAGPAAYYLVLGLGHA